MSEPNKIRTMADEAKEAQIRLKSEMAACTDDQERKRLREKIKGLRQLERWMRTRAGYA